jgi:hypothetical protein
MTTSQVLRIAVATDNEKAVSHPFLPMGLHAVDLAGETGTKIFPVVQFYT